MTEPNAQAVSTYAYSNGNPVSIGDKCLIGRRRGVWQIYHLGTFTNGRQYASLMHGQRRTAASLNELTRVAEATR